MRNYINITLYFKWQFKEYNHIKITNDKLIFNCRTGRQKKLTLNGGSIGIWLTPKTFIVQKHLNNHIELIPCTPF